MREGRSITEMLGAASAAEFGFVPGTRSTPGVTPVPNSEPVGAMSGAPPHTRFFNVQVIPFSAAQSKNAQPSQVVQSTRENRVALLTAPAVGFLIYVGDTGVSPARGMALIPGTVTEIILVGGQDLYAVTDAPCFLALQVQISIVLMAEQERRA
jgi:hypothetical protein